MKFKNWLGAKQYAKSTINATLQTVNYLEDWYKDDLKNLRYHELSKYIEKLQHEVQPQTINQRLTSIKLYFDYLIEQGELTANPARNVRVKNEKKVLKNLLTEEELNQLYEAYQPNKIRQKVLLGLIIYQAAEQGVLEQLQTEHINLDKGEIYLPATRRSNPRKLALKGNQMLPMYKYAQNHHQEKYFTISIHNQLTLLVKDLKAINKKVESIRQLRSSVITNWLKTYNLREVQYYCGHRYISSTEKYQAVDMEKLKNELKMYHPLG